MELYKVKFVAIPADKSIFIEMELDRTIWMKNLEPLVTHFGSLTNRASPVGCQTKEGDSHTVVVSWLVPMSLAPYFLYMFGQDETMDTSSLKKLMDLVYKGSMVLS